MKDNSVDINQRIPLSVLNLALQLYLQDKYDESYIKEQLFLEFSGNNRIKKSMRIINKVIKNNPLNKILIEHKAEVLLALKREGDKGLILISLVNSAFPFSFYVLQMFGKYLAVQDIINTQTVLKEISGIYGGNRATENGFYSVVPMFIEADILIRPKTGLYSKADMKEPVSSVARELYEASFKYNKDLEELTNFHFNDAYFEFVN